MNTKDLINRHALECDICGGFQPIPDMEFDVVPWYNIDGKDICPHCMEEIETVDVVLRLTDLIVLLDRRNSHER